MKDLTVGKEGKLILSFALPMLYGNIFQQLYNIIDSIIIGRYLGNEALAAVGASFPLIFTLVSFVIGIATGTTIIISQYFGAKDHHRVKLAIETMYIFLFFASIALTVLGITNSTLIFRLIDLPEEVIPQAVEYFNVYALGFIFFFWFSWHYSYFARAWRFQNTFVFSGDSYRHEYIARLVICSCIWLGY